MPIIEDEDMDDRILYWQALYEGPDGQWVFAEPIEICGDWVQRRSEASDGIGNRITIEASATVDRLIPVQSKLWLAPDWRLSALSQWYRNGSAGQADEVMRVVTNHGGWDAKKIERKFTVQMQWWRDHQ